MLRRHKMIISIKSEVDGFVRRKEIRSNWSCLRMLKHLKKRALIKDPYARIMNHGGVPTLVVHRIETPVLITVRLVEKGTEE
ncbi:MAG: hypothetical protein K0R05_3848 [Anaerocolumna sp.]|jgi:hypothetical protein|nr:hypothetical protein [Anaerocolumna sp.]